MIARYVAVGLLMLFAYPNVNAGEQPMQFNEPAKPMTFEQGKTYSAVIHTSKGRCHMSVKYQ